MFFLVGSVAVCTKLLKVGHFWHKPKPDSTKPAKSEKTQNTLLAPTKTGRPEEVSSRSPQGAPKTAAKKRNHAARLSPERPSVLRVHWTSAGDAGNEKWLLTPTNHPTGGFL